MEASV
jgi:hypothetical protein